MKKIIRITTSSGSLRSLLKGQLRFMSQYYEIIGVAHGDKGLRQVEENEGIKTVAVEMSRTISPLKDLIATYKLFKLFKAEKPFIVHTHTPKAGTLGMLAAKLAGVEHRFHTIAGMPLLEATGFKRKVLNSVEKITYSCATKIFPNSHGLYDIIVKNKFTTPDKLKVIGKGSSNGIDTSYFDPEQISDDIKHELRQELGIKETDFVFISIGRIVADKGLNELVTAFSELIKTKSNCKLILIGPSESHLDPIDKVTSNLIEASNDILFVGRQSDVRPYLSIAHVLTFPSYREGFPNVVLEAGAMQLPSIVTDINGCNEIIEDGKNGIIIPVKNTEKLLQAMLFFINNPEDRLKMTAYCRSKITSNYERSYIWNELLKEYQSLN